MWTKAGLLIAALGLAAPMMAPISAGAQEEHRLRPDTRLRPAPTERPAGKGMGEAKDQSIDDPNAVSQQDLVTRCRPEGAPANPQTGKALPDQAKKSEADETGNCVLPPSGQPLGNKAADKLADPKNSSK